MRVDQELTGDGNQDDLGRLAGLLEALNEAEEGVVGPCGAECTHVEHTAQVLVANADDLAWPAHGRARAVLTRRKVGQGGQGFRGELGDVRRTSRFDVGQLGQQDGGGNLAETGDAAQQGEVLTEDRIGGDEAAHRVHDGRDLRIKLGNVRGDRSRDSSRGEAELLTVEFLHAGRFERVATANQFAQLAQVRGRRYPRGRDLSEAEAGDQGRIEPVGLVVGEFAVTPSGGFAAV